MSSPIEPAAQQLIDDIAEGMAAGGMTVTEAFALSQAISLTAAIADIADRRGH